MSRTITRPGPSRITRTLVSAGLAAAAGLALFATQAGTAAADDAPTQCINPTCVVSLSTVAGGQTLSIDVVTAVPTSATVAALQGSTLAGKSDDDVLRTTHHLVTPASLTPNTHYTWHVWLRDSNGDVVLRSGEVSTLHRRLTVQFVTDTVTNDSDLTSNGDFRTIVALSDLHAIPPLMPVSIGSGETKLMGATLVKRDVGPATRIATEMYDDDSPFTSSYPGAEGATWDNGSSVFADWATAQGTLNTGSATRGLVPFQISVNSYVGFVVRGYYSVDFVS